MSRKIAVTVTALLAGLVTGLGSSVQAVQGAVVQENVRHLAHVPGTTGGHSVVEGNRLYVGAYGLGMRVFDITNPRAPVWIGQYIPGPQSAGDPGLRADAVPDAAVFDGRHIVTLNGTGRTGSTQQTEFIDFTNPAAPQVLYRFNGQNGTPSGEAHNGDIVDSRRLWLPSGSATPNFRIYDLNPLLASPAAAPKLVSPSSFSLVTAWQNSPFRKGRPVGGTGFTHIHDLEVYTDLSVLLTEDQWVDQDGDGVKDPTYGPRDLAFIAEGGDYFGGNNSGSLFVVDITNPAAPVVRNRFKHAPAAGHHVWRYFHEFQLLEGDKHIAFAADEDLHSGCDAGGVMSLRMSDDYTTMTELDEWFIGSGTPAAVCSAHVFSSNGNYVYMGSYNAGLQVIDFSNPAQLRRDGQYIAPGANSWGALYHKGVVYVGDFGGRGLDVFEHIASPAAKALLKVPNPATRDALGGVSEIVGECDPASPANGTDGLIVPIPAEKRDGTHRINAIGSAVGPYDLDIFFYDSECELMDTWYTTDGTDESGLIPKGAATAVVTLYLGVPTTAHAQLI